MQKRSARLIGSISVIGVMLVLWQAGSQTGFLPSSTFPSMTSTVESTFGLLSTSQFWHALGETLTGWLIGLLLATAVGIPLGMLLGRVPFIYRSTRLVVDFCSTIPSVAMIPFIILILGATMEMKIALVAYGAFWPILVQTAYGIRDTDKVLVDTARSYSITRWRTIVSILAPATLPYLVTGLRISAVVGLLLGISGEVLGSAPGLGLEMISAQSGGAVSRTYAYVVLIGLLGLLADRALNLGSRSVLFWHPSVRGVVI